MPILNGLTELLFPQRCLACATLGLSLCSNCRRWWNPHLYQTQLNNFKVISSVPYSDVAQKIILAAKESQIKIADDLVSSAIVHATSNAIRVRSVDFLVPIPSRPSAVRTRGRQFIADMSEESARLFDIPIADLLVHVRSVKDQSGLHLQERWNNLEGAFVVRNKQQGGGRALLIDDLITTGATLSEAARALRYAGIEVMGAVTAAIAQPLRYRGEMG